MSRSTDAEFLEAASTGQSHIVTSVLADLPPAEVESCASRASNLLRRRDIRRRTVSCKE